MRVYLDTCCLQRPLDSKTQIRIALEAEAVLGILALCESGEVELVSSDVLAFEVSRTPNPARQEFASQALATAKVFVPLNSSLEGRARELNQAGISPLGALHLASAEEGHADCFCTCDDRLLRKARGAASPKVRAVTPLELIQEMEYGGRGKTIS
jgi:predicted nucleic acid-binding protein